MSNEQDFIVVDPQKQEIEEKKPPTTAEIRQGRMANAMATYDPENKIYSSYLGESGTANTVTQEEIERLGEGAQDDVEKIRSINNIIRKYINIDDLLGMVHQSIWNNVNTEIRLSYKNFGEQRNKAKTLTKAKALINDFNAQVNIKKFIRDAVSMCYDEGNYLCLLRNDDTNWGISKLSLGIAEQSGYVEQDNPVILINIKNLTDALKASPLKNKKGKFLFFKDVGEEIQQTYNDIVYQAYKNKDTYARLDTAYTGTVRINSMGRRYGLSPIYRSLFPVLMLSNFNKADEATAQARAKKIIHQVMRKELLANYDPDANFEEMAYIHENFMKAFRQSTVVISTSPTVEKIMYVEPKVDDINVEKINIYRNKVLSSLGISFLANDKSQTAANAAISLQQLLQTINAISSQVETVIENFYRTLLTVNNIGLEYLPSVKIIDSELLDANLRMELSKLLFTTFNASLETSLSLVGIDLEDEKSKREKENSDGIQDIFTPRLTAFTNSGDSGDSDGGRSPDKNSNDPDKQLEDENYNKNARQ